MSFLKQLRDAGRKLPEMDPLRVCLLSAADEIAGRVAILSHGITKENLMALNGAWANADRLLSRANNPPPSGAGGAMPIPEAIRRAA